MSNSNRVKYWLVGALTLESAVLAYLLASDQPIYAAILGLCSALFLIAEWRTVGRYLSVDRMSIARVEQSLRSIPTHLEIVATNALSILLVVLSVQFIAVVYAMSFSLSQTMTENESTNNVVMADVDEDGDIDFVDFHAHSGGGNEYLIYSNNGSGIFGAGTEFGDALGGGRGEAGDINGDGCIDFIAVGSYGGQVEKFTNDCSGNFTDAVVYPSAMSLYGVRVFDANNDGSVDFVALGNSAVHNKLYLNDGSGNFFQAASTFPVLYGNVFDSADFDSDGDIDLVIPTTSGIKIYENSGTGAFVLLSTIALSPSDASFVATGDLDHDGDIDLVSNYDTTQNVLYRYFNDGQGTFTIQSAYTTTLNDVTDAVFADIDTDGFTDLLVSGRYTVINGGTIFYKGDGTGSFSATGTQTETTDQTMSVAVGDIDNDGDIDYVRGNSGQDRSYFSDQASTTINTSPTAPASDFSGELLSRRNRLTTLAPAGTSQSVSRVVVPSDSKPFIIFHDTQDNKLKAIKCGNRSCTSGNTTTNTTLDTNGHMTLALASDGLPIFAYYDTVLTGLQVVKCNNATCSSRTLGYSVSGDVGAWPSIAIPADGRPVISYYDFDANTLGFVRCGNSSCTTGTDHTSIDTSGFSVGSYTAIGISSDGYPSIAYRDNDYGGVKFVHCGNADCTSGNSVLYVDTTSDLGNFISMTIPSDGRPFIAYNSNLSDVLYVLKCGNSNCSSGNTSNTLGISGAAQTPSLFIGTDGLPTVVYNESDGMLVEHCQNAACSSTTQTILFSAYGLRPHIVAHDDGLPLISFYDSAAGSDNIRLFQCADDACATGGTDGVYTYRLRWGSGSDSVTPTKQLRYQLKLGTTSGGQDIVSPRTASPKWTSRMLPNGQRRSYLLNNLPCGQTYYWSVAAIDMGFRSSWSSEQVFTIDTDCSFTVGGSGGGTSGGGSTGGGIPWNVIRQQETLSGDDEEEGITTLTIRAWKDVNADGLKQAREQYAFKGAEGSVMGISDQGKKIHEKFTLGETGKTVLKLPPSNSDGYLVSLDTGSVVLSGYRFTRDSSTGGILLVKGQKSEISFGLVRSDQVAYSPCLSIGVPTTGMPAPGEAGQLLVRLRDIFDRPITVKDSFSDELVSRNEFFELLEKSQCLSRPTNVINPLQVIAERSNGRVVRELIDLPLASQPKDFDIVYRLLLQGVRSERSTLAGPAADLRSPISRREAIIALYDALQLQSESQESQQDLPLDNAEFSDILGEFTALRRLNILPQSFLKVFGPQKGVNPEEAAILIARSAFRRGKIDLLPPALDKSAKSKKSVKLPSTFLSQIPNFVFPSCINRNSARSTDLSFTDVYPGDPISYDVQELQTRYLTSKSERPLWVLPGTQRPTEYGVEKGLSKLNLKDTPSILEVLRGLLLLSCLPPDTPEDARSKGIEGSRDSKVARDKISNLPRDGSFASRILYRAQDHQKKFNLSIFSYAEHLLYKEIRSPSSPLTIDEASSLFASALLGIAVREELMTPQDAESKAQSLKIAIAKDLLGSSADWRNEGLLHTTLLTREMFLQYLATVVFGRMNAPDPNVVPSSFSVSLGEIWRDRVK